LSSCDREFITAVKGLCHLRYLVRGYPPNLMFHLQHTVLVYALYYSTNTHKIYFLYLKQIVCFELCVPKTNRLHNSELCQIL
jgi:hypothetical protein